MPSKEGLQRGVYLLFSVIAVLCIVRYLTERPPVAPKEPNPRFILTEYELKRYRCAKQAMTQKRLINSLRNIQEIAEQCGCECTGGQQSVPKVVHFIKTDNDFLPMEWLSLLSAHKFIQPDKIIVHAAKGPIEGCWWNRSQALINETNYLPVNLVPEQVNTFNVTQPAHKADFLRMIIVYELGGIYMDTDAMLMKSFDPLFALKKHVFSWCYKGFTLGKPTLGNGLLVVPKHSCFFCQYIRYAIKHFDGKQWSLNHGSYLLAAMVINLPEDMLTDVHVLKTDEGFFPQEDWDADGMFTKPQDKHNYNFDRLYSIHFYHFAREKPWVEYFSNYTYLTKGTPPIARSAQKVIPHSLRPEHFDNRYCVPLTY